MIKTYLLIALMTALFGTAGYALGGTGGMVIALGIAAVGNVTAWYNSDKIVLSMYGAKPVSQASNPKLHAMVAKLANKVGLPLPKVYIMQNPQPNAFATGRNPENGAVAVTTGLMQMLNDDEVEGVIAHELAHIQNRDTLIMTVTATLAGAIGTLASFGWLLGGSGNNRPHPLVLLAVMIVAPMLAMLVQMFISRTREYAADKRGAEISGQPLALASALAKISNTSKRVVNQKAEANPATAHMFIMNPLNGERADALFSTHPKTQNRIARLQAMVGSASMATRDPVITRPGSFPWLNKKQPWG